MLRFRSHVNTEKPNRNRWRLWMLVIALGLVLATMRQLGQPSTARRLGQLFTPPQPAAQQSSADLDVAVQETERTEEKDAGQEPLQTDALSVDETVEGLSHVKDKTYFRPAEHGAWFSLFAKLRQADDSQLLSETCGEVSYAQFLQQPEEYRGRVVTIVGTVMREEIQQPAENELGIDSYHRLWIQPQGGGQWPLVIYCLKLPAEFPRGENLRAPVSVTGYFFKNWSYAYQDGLGLAPVVLAGELQWQPPAAPSQSRPITSRNWTLAIALASAFAVVATWLAMRHTRRRSYAGAASQQLQDLAARESEA